MSGRKTQAQTIIELIDKRLKTLLGIQGVKGISKASVKQANFKSESSRAFENVSFITRDEHRGGGHGDLPNSRPSFDLDCELVPDNPEFCSAGLKKVLINGIPAALIVPSEDVRIHGKEIVEIVADRHIKDALGLDDGDQVIITDFDFVP